MMKVKYLGEEDLIDLTEGKIYEVMEEDQYGNYRIVDDSNDDYLYGKRLFEIVEE